MESPRKPDISVAYEPVAWDISIVKRGVEFLLNIRADDKHLSFPMPTLRAAQHEMELIGVGYYCGAGVPYSVFYRRKGA